MQDAHSGSVRQCLFSPALVLLGFEAGIGLRGLLLGVMDGAIGLGAYVPQLALVDALGDDGLGGVLARFELRPFRLFRGIGLLRLNLNVLAAGNDLAAFLLLAVSRADLHKLRLRCDLLLQKRFYLHGIAIWIGALRFVVRPLHK